jgi:hypothetical protein
MSSAAEATDDAVKNNAATFAKPRLEAHRRE